jgi:hypothetical protein
MLAVLAVAAGIVTEVNLLVEGIGLERLGDTCWAVEVGLVESSPAQSTGGEEEGGRMDDVPRMA